MSIPIIPAASYDEEMKLRVLPALEQTRTAGQFARIPGQPLYYELYTNPNAVGWVALSHGFTENIARYYEAIWTLLESGYSVAMVEHQGHGRSFRKVEPTWLTHIDRFDDYTEDFIAFLKQIVIPAAGKKPLYLLGHSMGGAIAIRVLETAPDLPIRKAVFSSPMVSPQTAGIPKWVTYAITVLFIALGKEKEILFNQHPYSGADEFDSPDCCTDCRPRYDWFQRLAAADPAFQNTAATYRWLQESLKVKKLILNDAAKINKPVLLCQAERDTMVHNEAEDGFIALVKGGRKAVIRGAKHESYRCTDEKVEQFWTEALEFFNS